MGIRTVSVKGTNSRDAARQAQEALKGFDPSFLLFFASSHYDGSNPAAELSAAFPNCKIIGSTSHSEYCNSDYTSHSISIMAMDRESIEDVSVEVVENIKQNPELSGVVQKMEGHFGGSEEIFNHFDHYVGIVLFESGAKSEEIFMDHLGTASDILFVGGSSSAAENNISKVYANGKDYTGAAILAILKTVNGYDVLKTQSAAIFSDRKLLVTKSNLAERILYEFDGRPCGEVYAEVLGVPLDKIQEYFVSNPLGIVADGEIFVRTFNELKDGGITLHCGLPEGAEINVLKIGDIVHDTREALDNMITYEPAGVINFNCLYRTFEILNKDLTGPYCALFGRYPSIGFSTGGEAFLGHINETSTILVIK
ncbi:hypothetical protein D7Y09_03255 [bacterium 1XD42-1]|nr:hypothetical protein D7X25_03230 [bacterium 1XD42-8]RKJ66687.1 hypothetical protein D7Y09_03255 [bacterium 1XD42-1]